MKKTLLFAAVVLAAILIARGSLIPVRAQTGKAPQVTIQSISPQPADTTMTVSGVANDGWTIQVNQATCSPGVESVSTYTNNAAQPAGWVIDPSSSGPQDTYAFNGSTMQLVPSTAGTIPVDCSLPTNNQIDNYTHTFSFSIPVSSLANGTHTLEVNINDGSGNPVAPTPMLFNVQHAASTCYQVDSEVARGYSASLNACVLDDNETYATSCTPSTNAACSTATQCGCQEVTCTPVAASFCGGGTAAPTVSITASPSSITLGASTNLTWTSTNATACTASVDWSGAQALNSSAVVTPAAVGSYDYAITCTGPGGKGADDAPVTVTAVGATVGTINVTSESSVNNNIFVTSSWAFSTGGGENLCPGYGGYCNNVSRQTYNNLPMDSYQLIPGTSASGLYALHSVERQEIARNSNFLQSLVNKIGGWLLAPAFADHTCYGYNTTPDISTSACPITQTIGNGLLVNNGDVDNFIILWDPQPVPALNPTSLSLTAPSSTASTTAQVKISNAGASDSSLTWTSSITYGSGSGWLTVLPSSGGPVVPGTPQAVTIIADPTTSSLPPGTYTATVKFTNVAKPNSSPQSLSVSFTVPAANGGGGNPPTITINSTPPVAACVPVSVTCAGSGACTWSAPGATSVATSGAGGCDLSATYCTVGTPTVTCTSGGLSASTSISIVPDCTITASPTAVVPPQASTLKWSCNPGTTNSVTIISFVNGQQTGVTSVCSGALNSCTNGTLSEAPTQNTTYELQSTASTYSGISSMPTTSVNVTVQGPGVIEGNPGG